MPPIMKLDGDLVGIDARTLTAKFESLKRVQVVGGRDLLYFQTTGA